MPYTIGESFVPRTKIRRTFGDDYTPRYAAEAASSLTAARARRQDGTDILPSDPDYAVALPRSPYATMDAGSPDAPYGAVRRWTPSSPDVATPQNDPRSELGQPSDPYGPIFRPQPEVGGRPSPVDDNAAGNAIKAAVRVGDRDSLYNVARLAWQREAALNGNPAGDAVAPQAYIDSWLGQLGAGEDAGPYGNALISAYRQDRSAGSEADAQRRAVVQADYQRRSTESSSRQGQAIRATAPATVATTDGLIGNLVSGAPSRPPQAPPSPASAPSAPAADMVTYRDQWGNEFTTTREAFNKRPGGNADVTVIASPAAPARQVATDTTAPSQRENLPDRGTAAPPQVLPDRGTAAPQTVNYSAVERVLANRNQPAPMAAGNEYEAWARSEAARLGINPDKAVEVANTEGGFNNPAQQNLQGAPAYSPYQLYIGGKDRPGLGDEALAAGIDPRNPADAKKAITFALEHAAQNGWGAFQGAAAHGIGDWDGIGRATAQAARSTGFTAVDSVLARFGTPGAVATAAPASGGGLDIKDVERRYTGGTYTFGGGRDANGIGIPGTRDIDCSGFVSAVMKERGVDLPAHTDAAYTKLRALGAQEITPDQAKPGDIVFYMGGGYGGAITYHMGLYAGPGQILDASRWKGDTGVKLRPLTHAGGMDDIVILRDPRVNGRADPRTATAPPPIVPTGVAETPAGDRLTHDGGA